jgi:hypothetical protein
MRRDREGRAVRGRRRQVTFKTRLGLAIALLAVGSLVAGSPVVLFLCQREDAPADGARAAARVAAAERMPVPRAVRSWASSGVAVSRAVSGAGTSGVQEEPTHAGSPADPVDEAPAQAAPPQALAWREPTPQAIRALERASRAQDAPALLRLVREDRSLVRFEALRRYLRVAQPGGLEAVRDLLASTSDPALTELIAEALSAGGTSVDADALAPLLHGQEGHKRLAAAQAIVRIADRTEVSPASVSAAVEVLAAQASERGALDALAESGQVGVLRQLASDRGLDERTRLLACEQLEGVAPREAAPLLATLAAEAHDPGVRRAASR